MQTLHCTDEGKRKIEQGITWCRGVKLHSPRSIILKKEGVKKSTLDD
jgi:hypothetical protein